SPADVAVWLAPVGDDREARPAAAAAGPYPVMWMSERWWPRPLPEMVRDVLKREFEESGLAARFADGPGPEAVVVRSTLLRARAGQEERPFGRRSLAEVVLRVEVLDPRAGDSAVTVFDEAFEGRFASDVTTRPPVLPVAFARALRQAIAAALERLDAADVTRRAVSRPLDAGGGR